MKINLTLVFAILLAMAIVAAVSTAVQTSGERNRMKYDLMEKSSQVTEEFLRTLEMYPDKQDSARMIHIAGGICRKNHVYGIAVFETPDEITFVTPAASVLVNHSQEGILLSFASDTATGRFFRAAGHYMFQYIRPVREDKVVERTVIIYWQADFVHKSIMQLLLGNFIRWSVQAIIVTLITLVILQWGIFTPLKHMVMWMRSARTGTGHPPSKKLFFHFLAPLHSEATRLAEAITQARAAAEEEVLLRTAGEAIWTPARLQTEAKSILKDRMLIVVSNREPYMHINEGREIKCIVPASGMVTAMEPILMACGGLWVASGSGNADKKVVDENDKIKVPPEEPKYTLRRVWVSEEEERHFYYGFSNEGLWPLCHVAHTRPLFRTEDWQYYRDVNQKFADAILGEIKSEDQPFILVQDYHFALLPAMIKKSRPDARVSIFWHIPWPNPESFGICPWQEDILLGMLGADLIGFHTQFHCNNFLSTVSRTLESRVAWESFTVTIGDHMTRVSPFPISISFTMKDFTNESDTDIPAASLLKRHGIKADLIGIGVDRIDYTKGILERFHAIERFLEKYPDYQGKFTFVQIGAPSRTFIDSYSNLVEEVEKEADRINRKLQTQDWRPILLLSRHHSHQEIAPFYQSASLCMVTSLHDGMNLVAKEFVASRSNGTGVLILSRFTGAAQELSEALIVNPYHTEEMADAIKTALEMPESEQQARMGQMRQTILRNNVYFWAAGFLKSMDAPRV